MICRYPALARRVNTKTEQGSDEVGTELHDCNEYVTKSNKSQPKSTKRVLGEITNSMPDTYSTSNSSAKIAKTKTSASNRSLSKMI